VPFAAATATSHTPPAAVGREMTNGTKAKELEFLEPDLCSSPPE
jgi:hypothetical protein